MNDALHAADDFRLGDIADADRVCDAFEAAWRDGPRPRVEDFVGSGPEALVCELICVDIEYRRTAGEEPTAVEYLSRFPNLDPAWLGQVLAAPVGATPTLPETRPDSPRRLGRFELKSKVGQGTYGTVWQAYDPRLDRTVALKVPHPGLIDSPDAAERFRREAQAVARLHHPGIVTVYDVATADGVPILVQDFVDGESLKEKLTPGRIPVRAAAELCAQLAEALDYAHRCGSIHRDVKPANVVVARDGRAVLVDFGLALQEGGTLTLTADGQLVGTPAYMSPEQAAGKAHLVDARTDVYGVGAVLYEVLTGRPPFQDTRVSLLLRRIIEEEPLPPRWCEPAVPRDLDTVCLRAMAKEPHRRYPSAGELATDLRRFLAGEPVKARPVGRVERVVRWIRCHPAPSAIAATTLIAVLATAVATVAWRYNRMLDAAYRQLNDTRRAEADQHQETETAYYFQRMAFASREWANGNTGRVTQLLAECPAKLRGWEWRYLDGLTRRDVFTILNNRPDGQSLPVMNAVYSPDGTRILTSDQKGLLRIWDATTGRPVRDIPASEWSTLGSAWHPDGRRIAAGDVIGRVGVWDAETGRQLSSWKVQERTVYRAVFSPDGRRLAVAAGEGTWESSERSHRTGEVRVWDLQTGREVLVLGGFEQAVTGLAFHPTGHRLATAEGAISSFGGLHQPGRLAVWDAVTGGQQWEGRGGDGPLTSVEYSPDGTTLAVAGWDRTVTLWDSEEGKVSRVLTGGHRDWVRGVAFSPDGRWLASAGSDAKVVLWDPIAGKQLRTYRGHSQSVHNVTFRPDGKRFASCSGDRSVKFWDPQSDQEAAVLPCDGPASAVAFHPGGQRLFSTGYAPARNRTLQPALIAWNLGDHTAVSRATGHGDRILCLDVSWDGRWVVSGGRDRVVRVWEYTSGPEEFRLVLATGKHEGPVSGVSLDPTGEAVAAASIRYDTPYVNFDELRVWDRRTGRETGRVSGRHPGPINAVAFSPSGGLIASALTGSPALSLRDGTTLKELAAPPFTRTVLCVAFSKDGHWVAAGGHGYEARVWDVSSLRGSSPQVATATNLRGHTRGVLAVAFSPDGTRVATGSEDATVKVWDRRTGQEVITLVGHTDAVTGVAFSPDGRVLASSSNDGTVRLWRTSN